MKTALIHDWLYSVSGAEKVLEAIYRLFPSKVYTLIYNQARFINFEIPSANICTTFIQKLPFGKNNYPYYLPLFPLAIESINVSDADIVISSSSSVAKGILTHAEQLHICYCHSPMRYIWDLYFQYLEDYALTRGVKGIFTKTLFRKLRAWDLTHRVDLFIANSYHVAKRINKIYGKKAEVIYPPVECAFFKGKKQNREEFYLTVSRLVPYKKVDEIVKAFSYMKDKKLVIAGEGPELFYLKQIATKNVDFVEYVSQEDLRLLMHRAKAFVYMAHEDFGIVSVEAQAAGLPVIAYGKGGVLETVINNSTGLFFGDQTAQSLVQAIKDFEKIEHCFDENYIQEQADRFSEKVFAKAFKNFVESAYERFKIGD